MSVERAVRQPNNPQEASDDEAEAVTERVRPVVSEDATTQQVPAVHGDEDGGLLNDTDNDDVQPDLQLVSDEDTADLDTTDGNFLQPQLEVVVDNTPETLRTEIANGIYALDTEARRVKDVIDGNKRWYSKFIQAHRAQELRYAELQQAIAQLHDMMQKLGENAQREQVTAMIDQYRALQQQLQEEHGVRFDGVEAPAADAWESVQDISSIATEVRDRGEPIMRVTEFGYAKQRGESEAQTLAGKMGEFGQDGGIYNRATGVAVAFDGISTVGSESYRVGVLIAQAMEKVLSSIPVDDFAQSQMSIEEYVAQQYQAAMESVLASLPADVFGGAVFVATRFLPEQQLLVSIKVGDGHIVLQDGQDANATVTELLQTPQQEQAQTSKKNRIDAYVARMNSIGGTSMYASEPRIDVRRIENPQLARLLLVSDGLDANVLQPSKKTDQPQTPTTVMQQGGIEFLRENTSVRKDDMYALQIELGQK